MPELTDSGNTNAAGHCIFSYRYHNGAERLGAALRKSLTNDPLDPVLWEPHYAAIDRRVSIILQGVRDCIDKSTVPDQVVQKI